MGRRVWPGGAIQSATLVRWGRRASLAGALPDRSTPSGRVTGVSRAPPPPLPADPARAGPVSDAYRSAISGSPPVPPRWSLTRRRARHNVHLAPTSRVWSCSRYAFAALPSSPRSRHRHGSLLAATRPRRGSHRMRIFRRASVRERFTRRAPTMPARRGYT